MALTAIVTKKEVIYAQPKLHNIVFNLVLKEGTLDVFTRDITCQFHDGDIVSAKIDLVISLMQIEIDNFKSARNIFNSSALNNAVISIQNGLTLL